MVLASRAHEKPRPVLIAVTSVSPVTATGVFEPVFVPLPSCPERFSPQHLTVRSASTIQEWL